MSPSSSCAPILRSVDTNFSFCIQVNSSHSQTITKFQQLLRQVPSFYLPCKIWRSWCAAGSCSRCALWQLTARNPRSSAGRLRVYAVQAADCGAPPRLTSAVCVSVRVQGGRGGGWWHTQRIGQLSGSDVPTLKSTLHRNENSHSVWSCSWCFMMLYFVFSW